MTHRTASIIGGIGRTLIGLGLIVLSFAAFQLWGTGLQEARAQQGLEEDFAVRQAQLAEVLADTDAPDGVINDGDDGGDLADDDDAAADPSDDPVVTRPEVAPALAAELATPLGEVLGSIEIPAIDVERQIVAGVRRDDLRKGPGHYPTTPLPGQAGNAAIAGHRTTYGEPFHDLDLLVPGDTIFVETLQGRFRYEVMAQTDDEGRQSGHAIIPPQQVEVLDDFGDNRLTLTACHPKFSARQRIVVVAVLASDPVASFPNPTTSPSELDGADDEFALDVGETVLTDEGALDEGLGWNFEERTPTIVWGVVAALLVAIGVVAGRLWNKWLSYAATAPFFLAALFVCFVHLDRMLPAL